MTKLIYIVGMGRSGSTLLDLLLDSHSNVRSLGGVRRMVRALHNDACPCGAPTGMECSFWTAVDEGVRGSLGLGLDRIDVESTDDAVFRRHNEALFDAAAREAGVDYLVDSSKSVSRLRRLMELTDLEIYPVHIVRDACGYVYSQRKRKGQKIVPAFSYVGRSLRTFQLLGGRSHSVVEYDRLALETEGCVQRLMPALGLEPEDGQLEWGGHLHHNVGGGAVMRKTSGSTVRLDEAWRRELSRRDQALIRTIAWPGRLVNRIKARHSGV